MSKKAKELSGLSKDELLNKAEDFRKELVKSRAQAKTTGMKNPSQIKQLRKAVARALTFANAAKETKPKAAKKESKKAGSKEDQ